MRRYHYKDQFLNMRQLEKLPECKVTPGELRDNIWKYKLSIPKALITPVKRKPHKAEFTYLVHGIPLTPNEICNLRECEISLPTLRSKLRKNNNIFSMQMLKRKKGDIPRSSHELTEYNEEQLKRHKEAIEKSKSKPIFSSQISFNGKLATSYREEYDYYNIVMNELRIPITDNKINITEFLKIRIE